MIIAPTRAACETIEIALGLHLDTVIEREHGAEVRALAASGTGFGIVAGTGTGKTLAVRPIAQAILRTETLRIGVINREREATPETPTWNVIVVTTGIARRWFQDGDILSRDTLVIDEIHQTSAELELCLALGKRVGCRFIWLSATVDPRFYAQYLQSSAVIQSTAFDPRKAADVRVVRKDPSDFLDDKFLQQVMKQKRGVGMFLPTRAAVEQVAGLVADRFRRITSAFYHGGEPIRVIRPFLEEGVEKPFFLAMTAAGQSALNIKGLDTVIIDDTRFTNVVERGKNVLTRTHLGNNEILQMAGRVHGRVDDGKVYILSDRDLHWSSLRPTEPDFQLAGDSERVALTCADLGVRADELDLPVPLDRGAYRRALQHLEGRGVIENGRLSRYGRLVEKLPVEREWAELIVHGEDTLMPYLAVMASVESLHRMTRDERDLGGLIVSGSDHLTAYNVYAEAFAKAGYMGEVYGLPRQLFDEAEINRWADRRGVLVKAIEDTALAMASVYRGVGLPLPDVMPLVTDEVRRAFCDLVARIMPFDLVIDEATVDGQEARVSKSSVCGSWGAVAGSLRYFADRHGVPRAAIEGTQVPMGLVRKYAQRGESRLTYDGRGKRDALIRESRLTYFGFDLERDEDVLDEFPEGQEQAARRAIAEALARGETRHVAVKRNRAAIEEARELYRRSAGTTPRLGLAELTAMYEEALGEVRSIREYRGAPLRLPLTGWVSPEERERLLALPGHLDLRNKPVGIEYDVEEGGGEDGRPATVGVARLVLPEKLARTLVDEELPRLDRPLRFVVHRGQRGSVRAATLRELQELLDRPWSPDERQAGREERDEERHRRRRERDAADVRGQFARERRHGRPGGGRGGDGRGRDDRKGRGGGGRRGR
ncbi:MAG: DEAD/DEAH box helicase [Gemmatimonadetes bacterium]|nr:DEAD/DEAH box helicase [Gemmatimonadota bacterium]MBK6454610.1 DEAD/DEAH box helicase [Gemmatimonadota bacterium]